MSEVDQHGQTVGTQTNIIHEQQPPLLNLHQISEPTSDFVGREDEIAALLAAFEGEGQGAVISGLRGMGGVGKTELAQILAKRLRERFPDAQINMNLRGASIDTEPATATEALQHVIRAFHPKEQLPDEVEALRGLYHSVLHGKRVLLLMDNARDTTQLAPLTPPPDGCALIVTSRYHFTLSGMEATNLDTLPPDEARKLLLHICPRVGPDAEVLAERCGYLPLALRLAASALKTRETLRVEDYLERLANEQGRLAALDEFKDLTNEERGIEASLAISYNLLDEPLQRFWRGLSVFPGQFDAAAAGSVGQFEDAKEAEKALGDLYAASMALWEEKTNRFRLHDLARDYARARLSDPERAGDEQRHAAHFYDVLRSANKLYKEGRDAMLEGLALFDREWPNIRAGQAWAAVHCESDKTTATLCKDYPNAGTYCLHLRLHSRDQIAWLEAAVEAARILEDRKAEGAHLGNLGIACHKLGEPQRAIEFYKQSLVIGRELGDRRSEGIDLLNLGSAYAEFGDPREAIKFYEQALGISRDFNDWRGEGTALGNLGNAHVLLGNPRKAIEFYEQHLVIVRENGDQCAEGGALGNLGLAYANHGEQLKAIEFYEQALVIHREIGNQLSEGIALDNLAGALSRTGRRDEAIGHAEKAVEIYEQLESPLAAKARAQLEALRKQTR